MKMNSLNMETLHLCCGPCPLPPLSSLSLAINNESNGPSLLQVAATACLGTWQVKRYTWKVELMETNKTKMASEPVDLPEGPQG